MKEVGKYQHFVDKRTKDEKKAIDSLRSDKRVSVTRTRGKDLVRMSKDSDFDGECREQVTNKVSV